MTKLLLNLHHLMQTTPRLQHNVHLLADVRVFSYPLLLVGIYLHAIHSDDKQQKTLALYIMTSAIAVFIINYIIKAFIHQPRPYETLALETPKEELMLNHLPTDSFPSDHAAVSATIAATLFFWGKKQQQKHRIYLSIPFALIALIMGSARIMIAIHRPIDILAGWLIGSSTAAALIYFTPLHQFLTTYCYNPLITLQNKIRQLFPQKK